MTGRGRPLGIAFDYGHTLVRFAVPLEAVRAAGDDLARRLPVADGPWEGRPAELAVAFGERVDELVLRGQLAQPGREVEIEAIHRAALSELLGRSVSPDLAEAAGASLQRAWIAGVEPIDESLPAVLDALQGRGLRLGLCSNAPYPPGLMREQLEALGLRRHFDATLFSSEIGWRKPHPRVFAELLRRMGLAPHQVWFVGDELEADIEGARAFGMRALLAPGAQADDPALERLETWAELLTLLG